MLIIKSDKIFNDNRWGFPHISMLFLLHFILLHLLLVFSVLPNVFLTPLLQFWVWFNTTEYKRNKPKILNKVGKI